MTAHPYATLEYANTLRHVGEPLYVPPWRTWVIAREIRPGLRDAMGTYPVACLAEDADVAAGLDALRLQGMVSVTLVVDGLSGPPLQSLQAAFGLGRPFKAHHLVDQVSGRYDPSRHHRLEVRRAERRGVDVREVRLADVLDAWIDLYRELGTRHRMSDVQSFPRDAFVALQACAGLTTIGAFVAGELVGCHLWIEHGAVVRSHLGASSAQGYAVGAAYAVYDHSLRRFGGKVVDLGGAAGVDVRGEDGLTRFKAGFANATRMSYVFGSMLDPAVYARLAADGPDGVRTDYFPAYRAPRGAAAAAGPVLEPHDRE